MEDSRDFDADVIDLRDYVDVVWRQRWVILGAIVLVVGAALAFSSLQEPVYEATAEIVLEPPAEGDSAEQVLFGGTDREAQPHVITARPIIERVMQEHGLDHTDDRAVQDFADSVDVNLQEGGVFEIAVRDEDPRRAAAVTQGLVDGYVARLQDRAEDRAEEEFAELDRHEEAALTNVRALQEQIADTTGTTRQSLEEERDQLYARLRWIEERRTALETAQETFATRMVDVIQPAFVPNQQVSPRPMRTGALALVLGGLLGVGLAFVRSWSSPRLHRPADVARVSAAPVLGTLGGSTGHGADPSEDYRAVRASLGAALHRVSVPEGQGHAIQLAPVETGGAAVVALELAASFGHIGARALVVDADIEHGAIAELIGATGQPGLVDVLTGQTSAPSVLHRRSDGAVEVMTAGTNAGAELDVISSPAMQQLVDKLRQRADVVIVSSRPALTSASTLELGRLVDGTVLVATTGRTSPADLEGALERLGQSDAPVGGVILADVGAPRAPAASWRPSSSRPGAAPPGATAAEAARARGSADVEADNAVR